MRQGYASLITWGRSMHCSSHEAGLCIAHLMRQGYALLITWGRSMHCSSHEAGPCIAHRMRQVYALLITWGRSLHYSSHEAGLCIAHHMRQVYLLLITWGRTIDLQGGTKDVACWRARKHFEIQILMVWPSNIYTSWETFMLCEFVCTYDKKHIR